VGQWLTCFATPVYCHRLTGPLRAARNGKGEHANSNGTAAASAGPAAALLHQDRVRLARELKKPFYLFLAAENYESDKPSTQSDEEKELQLTHRRAIEQCGDIYYQFTGREELPALLATPSAAR
jgi:hypothetical protein